MLPELLEEILLYLTTPELVAAHNASPFFRHCILHSPRLLRRDRWLLWLCPRKTPLTWYNWSWQKFNGHGFPVVGEVVKLIWRANYQTADMEFTCQFAPVQPVRLCPLAHLWDLAADRLPRCLIADDSFTCSVGIIATPGEVELYGDLVFTDPPIYEACAKLQYSHSSHSQYQECYITGERTVKSDYPLTVRGFLDAAFRMRGELSVHYEYCDDPVAGVVHRERSFEEVVSELIRQLGGHFDLVFNRSPVCFKGVSVLLSDEWVSEEEKLAEQVRGTLA
jgi:hypothetical protein